MTKEKNDDGCQQEAEDDDYDSGVGFGGVSDGVRETLARWFDGVAGAE